MNDTSYPYKLRLARMAYKIVKESIEKVEGQNELIDITCHWNGFITVDDTKFYEFELREHS